jgi:hypothetical protein
MQGDEFDKFIEEILDQKDLPGVTPDVRTQLQADLKQRLIDQINAALIDALTDEQAQEFNNLLDDPAFDDTAAQEFMSKSGVNVRKVTAHTMLRFRDLYLQPSPNRKVIQ